jgi:hypothetical protein
MELSHCLETLIEELDRLILIGATGRQRRGVTSAPVEVLRYLRQGAAAVATGAAAPESLRELLAQAEAGCLPESPLARHLDRLRALLCAAR